jgi:hypothetical protein
LGNLDELNSLYYMKNSTEEAAEQTSSAGAAFSPPASPSVNKYVVHTGDSQTQSNYSNGLNLEGT